MEIEMGRWRRGEGDKRVTRGWIGKMEIGIQGEKNWKVRLSGICSRLRLFPEYKSTFGYS